MRYKTIRILKCPKCGGDLKLNIDDREENKGLKVVSGMLECLKCGSSFRIKEGVAFIDLDSKL